MIFEPGTFRVADKRKAIPEWVKVACAIRAAFKARERGDYVWFQEFARSLQYDHRPALCDRPYNSYTEDFIPPQHDPDFIEAISRGKHLERTTGRKEGAEKTVTTRGSDVGERARIKSIQDTAIFHRALLAQKAGDYVGASAILATATKTRRPKKKIPSRPFPKRKK